MPRVIAAARATVDCTSRYRACAANAPPICPARQRAAGRARWLSWASLAYMTAEGAIAIVTAVLAGSVALLGLAPTR
jgi:hypothetical protein